MKHLFVLFAASSIAFASCQSAPEADKAATTDAKAVTTPASGNAYKADLGQSRIEFIGTKPVGKHHGVIMLREGNVTVENGTITAGKFIGDLNTLKTDDQDTAGNAKLTGHLKGDQFFDVGKFPDATFEITNVKAGIDTTGGNKVSMPGATHTITGNLTLKGITKSITFPAKVAVSDAAITTDASFNIDRTQWNLSYGNDKSLGDHFIYPEVNLTLHLVANK